MSKKCSKEELVMLITACKIQRYSTKESLEFLKSQGFEISERTFFKYKNRMKEDVAQKARFAIDGLVLEHLRKIEALELIDKELWHNYRQTKDPSIRIKILNSIRENQIYQSKFQEAIPSIIDKQIEAIHKLPLGNKLSSRLQLERRKNYLKRDVEHPPDSTFMHPVIIDNWKEEIDEIELEENRIKTVKV